jgi:hypothetical protein
MRRALIRGSRGRPKAECTRVIAESSCGAAGPESARRSTGGRARDPWARLHRNDRFEQPSPKAIGADCHQLVAGVNRRTDGQRAFSIGVE